MTYEEKQAEIKKLVALKAEYERLIKVITNEILKLRENGR